MRRFLAVLLFFFLAGSAQAQKPVIVHLPLVLRGANAVASCDNHWKIVVPEATTNKVLNPSAETTGNYSTAGGAVVARSTDYAKYGLYSYYLTTAASNDGLDLTLSALSSADHYVTFRSYGELPANWRVLVRTQYRTPVLLEQIDRHWRLYGVFIPAAEASTSTHLYILQRGEGGSSRYLDGFQVEAHDHWTTYADGSREGCGWNGTEHASTSTRSALSRAGGRVRDLAEDFSFYVTEHSGTGVGPQRLSVNDYALLPGGELNAVKAQARAWMLTGDFIADSEEDLHAKRQALLAVLDPSAYDTQPVLVRYTGAEVEKEIAAVYEDGLGISGLPVYYGPYRRDTTGSEWQEDYVFSERAAIRFLSPDPRWYEIGESAVELDVNDSATFRLVAGRLRETGQWDPLGPPAAPGIATYTSVRALAEDENYLYVGGFFTNFDNNANCNYVCRWSKTDHTWSSLSTGMTGAVYALALAPNGDLYAGGVFVNAGGVVCNNIARWNGVAWNALAAGADGTVKALAFDHGGNLYVGGEFPTVNAGTLTVHYVAMWDGSAWSALGAPAGVDNFVSALAIDRANNLYVGGVFTQTWGGTALNYVAKWDGSTWSALGSGPGTDDFVDAIAIAPGDNRVYVGGKFTHASGVDTDYIAVWNGTAWSALNGGTNGRVYVLRFGVDNILFLGGVFTSAGDVSLADRIAGWNGSAFFHLDLDLPSAPIVYAVLPSPISDPVTQNYSVWLGYSTTGTGYYAGLVTAENSGTVFSYPKIIFERIGGTDATVEMVRNERTVKILYFDYDLLDGESLIINLEPTEKSIVSSFWGPVPDAVFASSDFGDWRLEPGDNDITAFVNFDVVLYSAEITAWLTWRTPYLSLD